MIQLLSFAVSAESMALSRNLRADALAATAAFRGRQVAVTDSNGVDGELFSRMYMERGKPHTDSARFRARYTALLKQTNFKEGIAAQEIHAELGISVSTIGARPHTVYRYADLISKVAIADLLDIITLIHRNIYGSDGETRRTAYRQFIDRAMREENLSYRINDAGGVRFFVDEEFERSRASAVHGLTDERYRPAREALEDAHKRLLAQDTLGAVRLSFDAVENVFKQHYGVARLGASEVKSKLPADVTAAYSGRGIDAGNRLIAAFAEWTNAAHQFRHAPGSDDPSPPSLDMAVLLMSQAAGFLRWLLELRSNGS